MSTSNLTYKDYSFADHGDVYNILEKVFSRFGINYYLIGANARDVHLYKKGIKPNRGTADVDFAVMVPDFKIYNALFDALCELGFRKVNEPYRLFYDKTNTVIDLMPYGELEENYTVEQPEITMAQKLNTTIDNVQNILNYLLSGINYNSI